MDERRIHERSKAGQRVKLIHPAFGELTTTLNDMSNGGFFVELKGIDLPEKGSLIKIQLLDTPVAAGLTEMKVMRVTDTGIGIAFID